jgi:hypothetical protein
MRGEGEENRDKEGALKPMEHIDKDKPRGCFILQPIYESFDVDARIVQVILIQFKWSLIFKNDELTLVTSESKLLKTAMLQSLVSPSHIMTIR